MSYKDLRDFIKTIDEKGELKHVNGANWDVELSSISELVYREGKDPKPALLFDEIPGYPRGYRTLFGMLSSTWRISKMLGLPEDGIEPMRIHENWYQKSRKIHPISPKLVSSGPVMENIDSGDKIDMGKFPSPRFHELDRSRYFGTSHCVIQKDPDTGFVNLGTYRIMVVDKDHLALHATTGMHGNIIQTKYLDRKQVMPVAIATGLDPALWWVSCQMDTPWGTSEYESAGAIKGEPIEIIEGPHSKLPIPARAEIVVEGEIHPGEYVDEGPFGEWHGYYGNRGLKTVPEPLIRVKAVYYRNNPILTCAQPAAPPHDFNLMFSVGDSVAIRNRLESFGIPGVKAVWSHYSGSGGLFIVVSLEQLYSGHGLEAGLIASQYPAHMGAYTVVVEQDIDPSNLDQVLWAMVTRSRLDRQVHILPNCHTNNVNTTIPPEEKMAGDRQKPITAARVVIDACRDLSWKDDWYPVARVSPELRTKLLEKWRSVFD